jgi:hypothetical protein
MSPLSYLSERGFSVMVNGDTLEVSPNSRLTDDLRAFIKQHKPEIVQELRRQEQVVIEPAHPKAKPIYFEDALGRILGPCFPEFLAKADGHFWIVTTLAGSARWIRSDRLRSRQAFETQQPVIVSDPIPREVK